jgi:hypothetical protein
VFSKVVEDSGQTILRRRKYLYICWHVMSPKGRMNTITVEPAGIELLPFAVNEKHYDVRHRLSRSDRSKDSRKRGRISMRIERSMTIRRD